MLLGQAENSHQTLQNASKDVGQRIGSALVLTLGVDETNPRSVALNWADAGQVARRERLVVFDMRHVPRMDRMGVASMVRCIDRCHVRGGSVALCHVSPEALAVLELNGVQHLARVCDDPESAARILELESNV